MRAERHKGSTPAAAPESASILPIAVLLLTLALGTGGPALAQAPAAGTSATVQDRVITGDHVVEEGEVVNDIAVIGGTLTIRGEVAGEAVVVGGDLIVEPSGVVTGDATVTGGSIVQEGGRILGEMRTLQGDGAAAAAGAAATGAGEARRNADRARADADEIEARVRREMASRDHGSSWFAPIRRGFADLVSTLAFGLVLGGLGAVLVFYGRPHLETVSDTLRSSAVRSAGVGLAAGFLIVPAFVVMVVALAVSIVGIPVLLLAVPLYPLAIVAAAGLGLLGAAHAIGERTAEQKGPAFQRTGTNSYSYLFTGLGMLLTPLIVASFVEMTGFLAFLGVTLKVVTWAVIWVMTTAGFGAVILSRAGTRRAFVATPPDPILDDDPLFDDEPTTRTPRG